MLGVFWVTTQGWKSIPGRTDSVLEDVKTGERTPVTQSSDFCIFEYEDAGQHTPALKQGTGLMDPHPTAVEHSHTHLNNLT